MKDEGVTKVGTVLIQRRALLRGLFAAPAVIVADRLMPLRGVLMVEPFNLTATEIFQRMATMKFDFHEVVDWQSLMLDMMLRTTAPRSAT